MLSLFRLLILLMPCVDLGFPSSLLQVAYSELLCGSGVFAGQPWNCAVYKFTGESTYPHCDSQVGGSNNYCQNTATPSPSVRKQG